jgi:hypothetical protein
MEMERATIVGTRELVWEHDPGSGVENIRRYRALDLTKEQIDARRDSEHAEIEQELRRYKGF